MARRVDKEKVKQQLLSGMLPGEVAREWGCSRQYVSKVRQELVNEGKIERIKGGRPARPAKAIPKEKRMIADKAVLERVREAFERDWKYDEVLAERDLYREWFLNVLNHIIEITQKPSQTYLTMMEHSINVEELNEKQLDELQNKIRGEQARWFSQSIELAQWARGIKSMLETGEKGKRLEQIIKIAGGKK